MRHETHKSAASLMREAKLADGTGPSNFWGPGLANNTYIYVEKKNGNEQAIHARAHAGSPLSTSDHDSRLELSIRTQQFRSS